MQAQVIASADEAIRRHSRQVILTGGLLAALLALTGCGVFN